ncbi:hypothetical protein [Amycolatopsis sp. NPDC003731]
MTRLLLTGGVVAAALVTASTPATASPAATWPNDEFIVCVPVAPCPAQSNGGIVWGNRSALVQGQIRSLSTSGTTVYFEAYAGSTKVDSDTRTARPGADVPFDVSLSTNVVGGFDRVKIQICLPGPSQCSEPLHAHRDAVAEQLVG